MLAALGYGANVLVHALLVGLTAFVTYISFYKGVVLFTWHPPLMLLGVRASYRLSGTTCC